MIAHKGEGKIEGYVYCLHFPTPLWGGRKHSMHYIGWAKDWHRRIAQHQQGRGSRLMQVLAERNLTFRIACIAVRLEVGELEVTGKDLERYIKRTGHYKRFCPMCGGKLKDYREE